MTESLRNLHSDLPNWCQFIESIIPDPLERHRLQRAVGYTFGDSTDGQCLFSVFGPSDSGKTVFVRSIAAAFPAMCASIKQSVLTTRSRAPIDSRLLRLVGRRFAACNVDADSVKINKGQVIELATGSKMVLKRNGLGDSVINIPVKLWFFSRTSLPIYRADTLSYFKLFEFKKNRRLQIPGLEGYMTAPSMADQIQEWISEGIIQWQTWGLS